MGPLASCFSLSILAITDFVVIRVDLMSSNEDDFEFPFFRTRFSSGFLDLADLVDKQVVSLLNEFPCVEDLDFPFLNELFSDIKKFEHFVFPTMKKRLFVPCKCLPRKCKK